MKNAKRIAAFVIVLAMAFSMAHAYAADSETIDLRFSGTNNYTMAYEVLELVNKERTSRGLSAVSMDVDLLNTAMQRAAEIAIYYDHTRPDGTSCFTAFPARFEYSALGENIAIGQENSDEVMTDWMNSEGHRENILTAEYKSIGVGCFYQQGTIHWVQLFASDSARAPSPVPTNRIVNVSVSVAPGYCDLGLDLEEEGEDYQQAYLYNTNPEFPYSYIILSNDNVRYSSADSGVVKVSEGGVIPASEKMGFVQLACYIDGTLVYETAIVYADHDFTSGDVNSDGNIDNADLILVARYVVSIDVNIDLLAADVNFDNSVSNTDIIMIARYLVGLA